MKYAKSRKCYCCGPPYERCNLCVPNSIQKKQSRRSFRKKLKNSTKEEYIKNIPKKA